ncbi:transposase [Halorubrum persicum]|uniref:transposase n=1 Tax=Halorubrum persicum TaxID=1383844 RepID=UPI002695E76D
MRAAGSAALSNSPLVDQIPPCGRASGRSIRTAAALMGGVCVNGATPIRAHRPDAASIRAASHDGASLARRPIRATRSLTLLNHRPLTTPVPLYARWGLSRLSSHQSNLHCSAHWPHDTQTGRRVALRNTEKIESFAGDKGYDDQSLRDALRSEGICLLLRHRLFAAYNHAHNARLDSGLYGQRWMAETAFSAIKRRFGPAVHPRAWSREFRELVLTAAIYNLEQALKQ